MSFGGDADGLAVLEDERPRPSWRSCSTRRASPIAGPQTIAGVSARSPSVTVAWNVTTYDAGSR